MPDRQQSQKQFITKGQEICCDEGENHALRPGAAEVIHEEVLLDNGAKIRPARAVGQAINLQSVLNWGERAYDEVK